MLRSAREINGRSDMEGAAKPITALGRILISYIFLQASVGKIANTAGFVTNMTAHGMPLANILIYGAIVLELGGGLMLLTGLYTRWIAAALFFYVLALALIFHAYWAAPGAQVRFERTIFNNHMAIMGGLLFVVAFGAGEWSLDALLRRRRAEAPDAGLALAGKTR
jgi:putative oxidoreductase